LISNMAEEKIRNYNMAEEAKKKQKDPESKK
jgi:hypothetical protein